MTSRFYALTELKKGAYNWKIKVRVIRFWRGVTKAREETKGFNLLLLDDKSNRIHAFVPGSISEDVNKIVGLGNIYTFANFQVKEYKPEDKFRCIHNDTMIIFTHHTKIQPLMEKDAVIEKNSFDFYDLGDLKTQAQDTTYLNDVIGVAILDEPIRKFTNKNGVPQAQFKFNITDGCSVVKVTLCDSLAELLDNSLAKAVEKPLIVIIASARVGWWQDGSVKELRQVLQQPRYSHLKFTNEPTPITKVYSTYEILKFGKEFTETEVICELKIRHVATSQKWFFHVCTSCNREIEMQNEQYKCVICDRKVPYPLKKFLIAIVYSDKLGDIDIMLSDRQVRTLIQMTAHEVDDEVDGENNFPLILKKMENLDCIIKVMIKEGNIDKQLQLYWATDLVLSEGGQETQKETEDNTTTSGVIEASTSSNHLDGLSQLNFQSPEVSKGKN